MKIFNLISSEKVVNRLGTKTASRKGFTLIEVMIALFILSIIFSILYSSFFPTRKVINNIEKRREEWKVLASGLHILSNDIRTISLPASNAISLFNGNNTYTRQPMITFSAYTPFQSDGIGRLRKVAYDIEEDPDKRGTFILRTLLYQGSEEIIANVVIIDGLEEIEFSYFDGEDRKEKRDAKNSGNLPPKGVKVSISSKRGDISTIIPIEGS